MMDQVTQVDRKEVPHVNPDMSSSLLQGPSPGSRSGGQPPMKVSAAEKTFKACRACRQLKMRCEGPAPCTRCTASGAACIFDRIGVKKRGLDKEGQEKSKRQRIEDLEAELRSLRHQLPSDAAGGKVDTTHGKGTERKLFGSYTERSIGRTSATPVPPERERDRNNEVQTVQTDGQAPPDLFGLTPNDLQAPVTAVHAMTPDSSPAQSGRGLSPGQPSLHPPVLKPRDCISGGLISEAQGRRLFNLFMTGSNAFLPMLDPVQDTFDSLRIRSPFCFCVVLAIAARADNMDEASHELHEVCQAEARKLAGESLFIGVPTLEDVQAMTLLAAFSERTWFAIGHAMQMALVLGLHRAFPQLLKDRGAPTAQKRKHDKVLARNARTWLTVLHIEWEIAFGTARQPRLEQIDSMSLRAFVTHISSCASDLRILSIIELVQLRGRIQECISNSDDLATTAMTRVREAAAEFQSWWTFWDQLHEDNDYPQSSLQRTSLVLQRDYAKIFTCCTVLGKFQLSSSEKSHQREEERPSEATTSEMVAYVTEVIIKLLTFLSQSAEYRWNLKWAPTYSGLTIAFTTAFALKLSRLRPDLVDHGNIHALATATAKILETYPYENFYRLINLLLALPQGAPALAYQQDQFAGPDGSGDGGIFIQPPRRYKPIDYSRDSDGQISNGGNPNSQYSDSEVFASINNSIPTPMSGQSMTNSLSRAGIQYELQPNSFDSASRNFTAMEAPSWIFDTGSAGSLGLPNQGNASLFDFDMRLILDNDIFNSETQPS